MDQQRDILTGLGGLVEQVEREDKTLRSHLSGLSQRLAPFCSRTALYCPGDTIRLEECNDDEWIFGYLFCTERGLEVAWAFSGDVAAQEPGEETSFATKAIDEIPVTWLRSICAEPVIEAFLAKFRECVLARYEEMRSKVATLENVVVQPQSIAAGQFEQIARELGYDRITQDWRKAQGSAAADPATAIRMACVIVEAVCKHVLEDKKEQYDPKSDLPSLFKITRKVLGLSTGPNTEPTRNISSGLITIVENVGSFRNCVSDAHGHGLAGVSVTASDANLAVNAAGVVATFLLERWKSLKKLPPAC